ncbi:hypothetical protein [Clostridium ihumii]|uniref:hypothetical protein n=1 Tax=Clostridium ihumii TaxID=1470356 RepID=UPI00055539F1|nr:hypothetical protein [Clostridium ihumii]
MLNSKQVNKFVESLGLSYTWTNPEKGSNAIIVENSIEYKPFACKLKDLRTEKIYTYNTTDKFKELCKELSEIKK